MGRDTAAEQGSKGRAGRPVGSWRPRRRQRSLGLEPAPRIETEPPGLRPPAPLTTAPAAVPAPRSAAPGAGEGPLRDWARAAAREMSGKTNPGGGLASEGSPPGQGSVAWESTVLARRLEGAEFTSRGEILVSQERPGGLQGRPRPGARRRRGCSGRAGGTQRGQGAHARHKAKVPTWC